MTDKTTKTMFSSATEEWGTPPDLFDKLDQTYHFTLDAAASPENFKCEKYYSKTNNGLTRSWKGEVVFCNPPYGREIGKWVQKCWEECFYNGTKIVLLVPARTDTNWFHDFIYTRTHNNIRYEFIKGRLKFIQRGEIKNSAPFPSMLVYYNL